MGSREQEDVFAEKGDQQGEMIEEINERDEDKELRMSQWDICGSPEG